MQYFIKTVKSLFFGNYFYGICAVFLSVETTLLIGYNHLLPFSYILCLFFVTVAYYTNAYLSVQNANSFTNERSNWYSKHFHFIKQQQKIFILFSIAIIVLYIPQIIKYWSIFSIQNTLIAFSFPTVAIFYYGFEINNKTRQLRMLGLLKPFIIGFVWAGIVTIYPIFAIAFFEEVPVKINLLVCLLFLQNGLFISTLCIMFDIKDYATDYNQQLKTFVVRLGLRKTIFFILIPHILLGYLFFVSFAIEQYVSTYKILILSIPFICLTIVAFSLQKRKKILYYLAIIDGLMLLKAFCGIFAFTCIN